MVGCHACRCVVPSDIPQIHANFNVGRQALYVIWSAIQNFLGCRVLVRDATIGIGVPIDLTGIPGKLPCMSRLLTGAGAASPKSKFLRRSIWLH
jgi:hypothetical protein